MVHHLALINKLRGNKFTYNRAIQRVRKVISLLLTMFLAHSLDLILILQYSEYLILPFCLFVCLFFLLPSISRQQTIFLSDLRFLVHGSINL